MDRTKRSFSVLVWRNDSLTRYRQPGPQFFSSQKSPAVCYPGYLLAVM